MIMVAPFALALLAAQAGPAPAEACPSVRAELPAALAGWTDTAPAPVLGKAFVVPATDPATIRGLLPSELARPGGAALVPFEVTENATYRIAVSTRAWIDVAAGKAIAKSTGHSHGPACSGIAKMVDFPLRRGRYALHLSGIGAPSVRVLIART